jgi:hypothetical protein
MYLILSSSKDTYITNKIVNNSFRATDANVGSAGTLDLFKLYDESSVSGEDTPVELSKILIKFDLSPLKNLHNQGKVDITSNKFRTELKLHDVYGGQTTPANFRLICRPLSQSFDEGNGRDIVTFSDLGSSNYLTASYRNNTVYAWNQSGASASGSLKNPNIDVISSGTFSDVNTSLSSEQFFISGEEDLLVNVTNAISGTLTNQMSDHGFIIEYSGSYTKDSKSYFVKRFASRNASRSDLYPKLIVRYDDSIIDNHANFVFDVTGTLFLQNSNRNVLSNIVSGAAATSISGNNSLLLMISSGSLSKGNFYSKVMSASQHKLGDNYQSGMYSASFSISQFSASNTSTQLFENRNGSLQTEVNNAGSASFKTIWSSIDRTVGYHTGTLVIKSPFKTSNQVEGDNYLVTVKSLNAFYRSDDIANIRVFVENRNKDVIFVKKPLEAKSEIFSNMYYQVRDSETKKIIIPFDYDLNSTRMSADTLGMFFKLHMISLPKGKTYELEFLIRDFAEDIFIQNTAGKFVVN